MDKRLTCARCGEEFTWTSSQQNYYAMNGLNAPKRCKGCRGKKSYTQEELEADLYVIELARHIARTDLLDGKMGGLEFNRVMDKLDAEQRRCEMRSLMGKLDFINGRKNALARQQKVASPARAHAMLTQMEREKPQTFKQVSQQRAKE